MEHIALYRKWRPQTFEALVGQEAISQTLLNAIRTEQMAHAYLFCGPRGTGKTSTARLLAKALNCEANGQGEPCNQCRNCLEITNGSSLDVVEIDAASNRGIENIRDLKEKVRFSAVGSRYRVFIIDEFHMLSNEAFNALLKTLEEPPPRVIFVLATTEAHKILATIISRCQRFDFQRIATPALKTYVAQVAQAEGIGISERALEALIRKAGGGLRDALSLLDQVKAMGLDEGSGIADTTVFHILGVVESEALLGLLQAISQADILGALANVRALLNQGHEAGRIVQELIELLRHLLVADLDASRMGALGVPSHLIGDLQRVAKDFPASQTVRLITQLVKTHDRLNRSTQPDIWLEADMIHICAGHFLQEQPLAQVTLPPQRVVSDAPIEPSGVISPVPAPTVALQVKPERSLSSPEAEASPPEPEPSLATAANTGTFTDPNALWQRLLVHLKDHYTPGYARLSQSRLRMVDHINKILHVQLSAQMKNQLSDRSKINWLYSALEQISDVPFTIQFEASEMDLTVSQELPPVAVSRPVLVPLPAQEGQRNTPVPLAEQPSIHTLPVVAKENKEKLLLSVSPPLQNIAELFRGCVIQIHSTAAKNR